MTNTLLKAVQGRMASSPKRTKVFISYSHQDARFLKELQVHLTPEVRQGTIEVWDDTLLQGGEAWRDEIDRALSSAKVAIVLVSAYFRASRFIADHELPPLLTAAKRDGAIIIPVIVGGCDFRSSELAHVQAMNDPNSPLNGMRPYERNKVWVRVVQRVKEILAPPSTRPSGWTASASRTSPTWFSLPIQELISYCSQLNKDAHYKEAHQLLAQLTARYQFNARLWFEYGYALSNLGHGDEAREAFGRGYAISQQQGGRVGIEFLGVDDRFRVVSGSGSGTFNHGLRTVPGAIYLIGEYGREQVTFNSLTGTSAHVTSNSAQPWVAIAVKHARSQAK